MVRTARDEGRRLRPPRPRGWRREAPPDAHEDVRVAWQYVTGTGWPESADNFLDLLGTFTPDAVLWVAGHPKVRRRSGRAAVEVLVQELMHQSTNALAEEQKREQARVQAAEAQLDADFHFRACTRSQKTPDWRLGRSPGSFGGTRRS